METGNLTTVITFPGINSAQANQLAESFSKTVLQTSHEVTVSRSKDRTDTLDAGAILTIVLSSAATTAVAHGISNWLAKHSGTMIEIVKPDGTKVSVKYASGKDTAKVVEATLGGAGK